MRYIPHTPNDISEMLARIGVQDVGALFAQIPQRFQLHAPLDVPAALGEPELVSLLSGLAGRNADPAKTKAFLGGGVYAHHVPAAVNHLLLRSEFYTSYTPYQPEISQGTLQAIFEFQTLVAELLGVDVANASLYDGSTAMAEGVLMARRVTRRDGVILAGNVHPEYRDVTRTYMAREHEQVTELPFDGRGLVDLDALRAAVDTRAACVVVQYPSFLGTLDDVRAIADITHAQGALLVVTFTDAFAFGLLEPPGRLGADIVAGEGQALGVPQSFGGPHVGFFGTRNPYLRQVPGRFVGQTNDNRGQRGFVLTLTTREQHIRREKATSNICTNENLVALAATITMCLLGPQGLAEVALECAAAARTLRARIATLPGYSIAFGEGPCFHEFVVRTPRPAAAIVAQAASQGIAPGIALGPLLRGVADADRLLLVCTTEVHSPADHDALIAALGHPA